VVNSGNAKINVYDANGAYQTQFGSGMNDPSQVLVDGASSRLYVSDYGNSRVVVWNLDGTSAVTYGSGDLSQPHGMALDGLGYLYVADTNHHRIMKYDLSTGAAAATFGAGQGTWPGKLYSPEGIAFDAENRLWVAENGNKRFSVFATDGSFLKAVTVVGTTLNDPYQVRFKDGMIWELDRAPDACRCSTSRAIYWPPKAAPDGWTDRCVTAEVSSSTATTLLYGRLQ
jgi:DNA-binding beta-propeller fold protein YncE